MTTKFKILSIISFIALAVVLTFVGVWAVTDLNFMVGGDITYTAPEQAGDPPYITMGSYNGQDVQWKLIGVDGNHFAGGDMPTSGMGTFILETNLGITKQYYDDSDYYDYYESELRAYLLGDFVSTLSLTNNTIYKNITKRTIKDLYTDMDWAYWGGEVTSISTSVNASDSLWLLSAKEAYTLLGGGTILNNYLPVSYEWEENIRNNISWNGIIWWLRGGYALDINVVDTNVSNTIYNVSSWNEHSLRPAFNIDLSKL